MRPSLLLSVAAAVAAHHSQPLNLVQRDPTARPITHADLVAVAESMPLEKRISEDFDLGHQLLDKTLFNGNLVSAGTPAKVLGLKVTCKECSTKGTITARLTTENIVKPVVRFEFKGVEATANMDVVASGTLAFTLNLFTSQTPLGISVPGLKLGLLFSVDLAFSLSDSVDLAGGFHMKLPDDAFFELDVFDGDIQDKLFDGSGFSAIPITVHTGAATFKADLRLRVDLAAAAGIKGLGGAGVGAGVFANLVEFVARVNRTDDCFLQAQEFFDVNVGATASAGFGAGLKTFNVVPGVSTTLLMSPTETQCLVKENPISAVKPTGTAPESVSSPAGGNATATTPTGWRRPTSMPPMVTPPAPSDLVYKRAGAETYVITTCASDIINCPPALASIITVTETAAAVAVAAAITEAPEADTLAVDATREFVYLSAMATPIVHSVS